MEENMIEMEYLINGEKYLITVTKVVEDKDETTTSTLEVLEEDTKEGTPVIPFSVEDMPENIDVVTWLDIIDRYGIILTK